MKFSLTKDKATYRIDFNLKGKRKRFYPGTNDETEAKQLVKRMEYEWSLGDFDLTLQAYKLKNKQQPVPEPIILEADPALLSLWNDYVDSLHLPPATKNGHYYDIGRLIIKHNPKASEVEWYARLREEWAVSTWSCKKSYLNSCMNWAIEEGLYTGKNSYKRLKAAKKNTTDKIKPFSKDEIHQILDALESNIYCNKNGRYKHSHYVPFVSFLFITGCRLGEAIGLTWDCIDFKTRTITIKQALGKDKATSPNTTRKILKPTKTGRTHYIPMNDSLIQLLLDVGVKDKGFVFKGHKGSYIGLDNFRQNVWKPLLEKLGIPYRYPYQSRHTVLSNVTEHHGLAAAAKLAGHVDLSMVSKHYVRYTGDLEQVLPEL